jgi:hypothetical protein
MREQDSWAILQLVPDEEKDLADLVGLIEKSLAVWRLNRMAFR